MCMRVCDSHCPILCVCVDWIKNFQTHSSVKRKKSLLREETLLAWGGGRLPDDQGEPSPSVWLHLFIVQG